MLKNAESELTDDQIESLAVLASMDMYTADAWRIKATSLRAAMWRLTWFVNTAISMVDDIDVFKPVRKEHPHDTSALSGTVPGSFLLQSR